MVKCLDLSVFQQDKASYSFSLLFVIHFPLLPCSVCTLRLKKKEVYSFTAVMNVFDVKASLPQIRNGDFFCYFFPLLPVSCCI